MAAEATTTAVTTGEVPPRPTAIVIENGSPAGVVEETGGHRGERVRVTVSPDVADEVHGTPTAD